jgi:Nif-specific regulatory protein
MNAFRDDEINERIRIERSPAMEHVYGLVTHVARGNAAVLLRGERGTGTTAIARAIHQLSARARNPFVTVSWPEVTESFVESALFGLVPATANAAQSKGKIEEAEGGTLFIEEVGDFSLAMQSKLMRCIRERTFVKPGSNTPQPADVRIVAASRQELDRLIAEGRFLKDFCDELSVFSIRIPPLRERKTDILLLAQHYLRRHAEAAGKSILRLSSQATSRLLDYAWPGNLSELEHCIEHAVLLCNTNAIELDHLPPALQSAEPGAPITEDSLPATLESVERTLIVDALRASNGNRSKAAQLLGITERLMGLRVRKYGIEPRTYRSGGV